MSQPVMDTEAARSAGVTVNEELFVDYFGFEDQDKHYLPDGKQYFLLQRMNEGQKSRYQKDIRSDITIARSTGDAKMKADPAGERHALIKACVIDWYMLRKGSDGHPEPIPFSGPGAGGRNAPSLEKWLSVADPKLVEDLEKACRKLNPWLLSEMSVEDIDREIDSLKEMREEAVKREQGE